MIESRQSGQLLHWPAAFLAIGFWLRRASGRHFVGQDTLPKRKASSVLASKGRFPAVSRVGNRPDASQPKDKAGSQALVSTCGAKFIARHPTKRFGVANALLITIQLRRPREDDPGLVDEAWYRVEARVVMLTDRYGVPLPGEDNRRTLRPNETTREGAARLLRARSRSRPAGYPRVVY